MAWSAAAAPQVKDESQYVPKLYSPEDILKMIQESSQTQQTYSPICAALYGEDGTCKSGVMLDSRSKEEIKEEKKVVVIDLDNSSGPLKTKFFRNDGNIVVLDPVELDPKGDIDYVSSYNKVLAIVKYLNEHESELNMATVGLDGLDSLLKGCEYVMRFEDLKVDKDTQIKDQWQWTRRNRRFLTIVLMVKRLKCNRFFTTHFKEVKKYQGGELQTVGRVPDWEKSTPGIMFQKLLMTRKQVENRVLFEANVEKCKGALHLEGKTYTIAEVTPAATRWHGLRAFFEELKLSFVE